LARRPETIRVSAAFGVRKDAPMNKPAKSPETPAEGANDIPQRNEGSPTPAKDAPAPGAEPAGKGTRGAPRHR
jgi:hypothetical protein